MAPRRSAATGSGGGPTILGVDPGSRVTGWAVVDGRSGQTHLVAAGNLRLGADRDLPDRLARLRVGLSEILDRYQPALAAVESVFAGVDPQALIRLSHARGVILEAIGARGIPLRELTPQQVKSAVVGYGRAEKQQVQRMVGLSVAGAGRLPKDAADALAVALTAQVRFGLERAIAER